MANNLKTVALLAFLGGVFVAIGWLFGGQQGALIALGFAVVINFGMYWFSDKMAISAARARPVEEHEMPEVYGMVRSLANRMNIPEPRIYFIDAPQPNAFATGRNPRHAAIAVTRGIVEMMSYQELETILAHELSHVKNRDILIGTIAATIGAAMSFFARMAFWGGMGRRNDNGAIGAIAAIAAVIIGGTSFAVCNKVWMSYTDLDGNPQIIEGDALVGWWSAFGTSATVASSWVSLEIPFDQDALDAFGIPAASGLATADVVTTEAINHSQAEGPQNRRFGGNGLRHGGRSATPVPCAHRTHPPS